MRNGNRLTPDEEARLFREHCQRLGSVDRVYILHTGKNKLTCAKDKPSPSIRTRIKKLYADIQRKPAFLVLYAIGKMLFPLLMFHLAAFIWLLPLMVGKCK